MTVRHANADKVRRSRGMLLLFSQPQFLFRFIPVAFAFGLNVDHILRQDSSFKAARPTVASSPNSLQFLCPS
jgi:hypothetical protein